MNYIKHPLIKDNTIESRVYQEVTVVRALERGNTLVVAPTALGKTPIAIMLSAQLAKKGKILFLAPTKPLVAQHKKSYEKMTNFKNLAMFTGETKVNERKKEWETAEVVFATPQTIESTIFAGQINLSEVALLVVDEAHRAVGDYAYVFIADQYARKSKGLILALTASPGSSREKIQEICGNLHIKNIEVKNEDDEDVKDYVNEKQVKLTPVELPLEFIELKNLVEPVMQDILKELKDAGYAKNTSLRWYNRTNLLKMQGYLLKIRGREPKAYKAISLVAALMKLYHAHELIETQGTEQIHDYFKKMRSDNTKAAKKIMGYLKIQKAIGIIDGMKDRNIQHPKLEKLLNVLGEDQTIVFTHYRTSAKQVEKYLKEHGLKAKQFVGQSKKDGEKGLRQKEQLNLIQRFREREFQVLVATSVAEEGLDIPSVDLVVFYEPVASEIRKIQRSGRTGRHDKGKIVVLYAKSTRDEAYLWASWQKEKKMKEVLKEMSNEKIPQQTLAEFSEKPSKAVVYVDHRERASGVTRELMNKEVEVKTIQLPVGDYLISDRACIERKSCEDFVQSMIDGRLFNQAQELKNNFSNPLIIIEGESLYDVRNVHPNTIRGALGAITIDYAIPILWTKNALETADLVAYLARREQEGKERQVRLRGEKKQFSGKEQALYIIESLPGVGGGLAKNLLEEFGSVERVFNAGEKELKTVDLLGEKKAKEIRKVITKDFKE